ncbi:MAG: energy-coupling factor transporter transmembrane component T family protein [Candidatus Limnocylindria bacterium]
MNTRSYLGARDPTVKLAVALVLSLLLLAVIDPVTPLLVLAGTVGAGTIFGRIPAGTYARALAPLVLVALGFVWTYALFSRVADPASVLWSLGPMRLTLSGLLFGVAIGLRGLAIGAISVTFVLTTDPTRLVVSLIQNGRLPFRIGYPLLAAYRFLPFFREELGRIELARRVRGELAPASAGERLRRRAGAMVPLFVTAARRATRIAIAMDARGFAAARRRTYLRELPVTKGDLAFAAVAVLAGLSLLGAGVIGGWLRIWDGRFTL